MTPFELVELIRADGWFHSLGNFREREGFLRVPNFEWRLWPMPPTGEDPAVSRVVAQLIWLPTSRDAEDVVCGEELDRRTAASGRADEIGRTTIAVYKAALQHLRSFSGHPLLRFGPHDATEAAKGAALFAVRRAALEAELGDDGFWCGLLRIYSEGNWPFAITADRKVVVL